MQCHEEQVNSTLLMENSTNSMVAMHTAHHKYWYIYDPFHRINLG